MKLIIVDFLRRWWVAYLIVALLLGAVGAEDGLDADVTFVCFFMLPIAFELGFRPVGVMAALPVSRKTIAMSYWCMAVLLPVLLMAASIGLVVLPFHAVAISSRSIALALFSSLAIAGSSYCIFTLMQLGGIGGDSFQYLAGSLVALWFSAGMVSFIYHKFLNLTKQGVAAWFLAALGLLLTVQGYLRSEKFIAVNARNRPAVGRCPARSPQRVPSFKPGMARFGGVFFEVVRTGFLAGLCFLLGFSFFSLFLKTRSGKDDGFLWAMLLAFAGMVPFSPLYGGKKLLRSLPLSAGKLALRLLLMPMSGLLGLIAAGAVFHWMNPDRFPIPHLATFIIPIAGAVCVTSSFMVRFGKNGSLIAMPLLMAALGGIFGSGSNVEWPPVLGWLLGLCLMLAAFFLSRHWLRSSASYRPSPALR